ncbi:hypothetical protein RHSIM_Rhsim03G0261900 [Rhododendron simsii]|uniref:EamA domain-containing protein n=1 Tax=Rhododendron simsii TaxID=118357 RepID=A0A834HBS7_RHOSS|nr:hypothetical protein RHSIM_Rhsim03G0261900 [Rhododendron simsii]
MWKLLVRSTDTPSPMLASIYSGQWVYVSPYILVNHLVVFWQLIKCTLYIDMSGIDYYKPVMAMIGMQLTYAGVALSTRAALLQGMSPSVFVFYRQGVATLVIAPIAYFARRSERSCLGLRSFCLIFLASLVGVAINQNIYFEGIYLASSSMGSALFNLVPAITFVAAFVIGLEKVDIRTLRSIAKIIGTVLCVGGAVSMVLLRGPKLLNNSGSKNWLVGSFLLFGSSCCWSFWIIFQVPVSASYPDHLSLSAWMCFMATFQSGTIALFLERNPEAWILHSYLELASCLYAVRIWLVLWIKDSKINSKPSKSTHNIEEFKRIGIIGSATSFFVQAWCISRRGPLFCAMFSPLATVIVTIFASIFLHEEIYIGSLIGAVGVIIGLYVVLWGKAQDHEKLETDTVSISNDDQSTIAEILVDGSSKNMTCTSTTDLKKPFLFV